MSITLENHSYLKNRFGIMAEKEIQLNINDDEQNAVLIKTLEVIERLGKNEHVKVMLERLAKC